MGGSPLTGLFLLSDCFQGRMIVIRLSRDLFKPFTIDDVCG